MTLIKKADVPAYRAARRSNGLHLVKKTDDAARSVRQEANPAVEPNPTAFADDFSLDHSAPGGAVSAIVFPDPAIQAQSVKAPGAKHL